MNKITMLAVVLTTASLSYTIGAFAPQSVISQGVATATSPVRGALNSLGSNSRAQNVNSYDENAFSSGQPQEMVMDLDGQDDIDTGLYGQDDIGSGLYGQDDIGTNVYGQDTAGVDFDGQDGVGIGAENIIGLNQY